MTWPWAVVVIAVCFTLCFIVYAIVNMDPPNE
jgi:hypothetical protein